MAMKNAIQQFRITGWPGRLPHPLRMEHYRYTLDNEGVFTGRLAGGAARNRRQGPTPREGFRPAHEVAATGETYLELVAIDPSDSEAIARFVTRHGILGISYNDYALVRFLPGFAAAVRPVLEASWPNGRREGLDERLHRGIMLVETLTEFRLGLACIRDLFIAWQILQADQASPEPDAHWDSVPAGHPIEPPAHDDRARPADKAAQARSYLVTMMDCGLEPYHPRLLDPDLYHTHPGYALFGPLYSVCCLELYNHILEHASYRQCANDTCRRTFVRQTGRAQQGQHRSEGIKYCSSHCARAQAQREYRARKRAANRSNPPEQDAQA
jgi:hypothetical protein